MAYNENKNKAIEVGKFYLIHDGSKTGHPGLVVWKNDDMNRYLVIRTESDKQGKITKRELERQHLIDLKHPTDNMVVKSYIRIRPMMCKRKDIGGELPKMSLSKDDLNIIENVSMNNPEMSPSLRNKRIK